MTRKSCASARLRYLLDEDLNPATAEIARGLRLDAVSVHEIDRRGFGDDEQLAFAASQGRVFVTRNRDDFVKLTVDLFQLQRPHRGVLIVPRSLPNHDAPRMAHALKRWHDRYEPTPPQDYFVDFLSP